jgi:hypothetical protein
MIPPPGMVLSGLVFEMSRAGRSGGQKVILASSQLGLLGAYSSYRALDCAKTVYDGDVLVLALRIVLPLEDIVV